MKSVKDASLNAAGYRSAFGCVSVWEGHSTEHAQDLRRVSIRAFGGPTYSALVSEKLPVATVKTARRTGDVCRLQQAQCGVLAFHFLSRGDEFIHFDETVESRHSSGVFAISVGKTKFPEVNRKQGVGCSCSWLRILFMFIRQKSALEDWANGARQTSSSLRFVATCFTSVFKRLVPTTPS